MPTRSQLTVSVCLSLMAAGLSGCNTSPQAKEAQFLRRGQTLRESKDYQRAVLEFRNAASVMPQDAEPYYQMALAYLGTRDLENAVSALNQATALNPKHPGAQLKLAELMENTRDEKLIAEAASRIQGAFGASPADPEAIQALAITEWKLGKPEEAAERLEEALKKFPAHLQSSQTLARIKLSRNDWTGAEEVLKRAVADAPKSSPAALALGEFYAFVRQFEKAELTLRRSMELDPANGAALLALAGVQSAANKMDDAERTYRQVAALPGKDFKPLHAIFLYQLGRPEEAVAELNALVKSNPEDRGVRTALVAAYVGMKQSSKAENVLAAALRRNPKDTDALLQRAELRLPLGRVDDAENDLQQVLLQDSNSARAHFALAVVHKSRGLNQLQRQDLQNALILDPTLLPARLQLSVNLLGAKQAQAALQLLSEAPDFQKNDSGWILAHNWVLLSMGNLSAAKTGIAQAFLRDRGMPAVVFQNAVLLFVQRDYVGALGNLEELLKRNPADTDAVNLLLQVYEAQHDVPQGTERIRQLAAAHPDSAPLQNLLGQWYRRTNNIIAARRAFEAAKAADPHFIPADLVLAEMDIRDGRNDAARQRLNSAVSANPTNIAALLLSARADGQSGDSRAAILRYRAVVNIDRSNLLALNNLAYLLAQDSPDEALKYAQEAAEIAPVDPVVQDTLGWIYYRKGLSSMAVRYLKAAVDQESTPRRQFHLGMSYLKMGDQATGQKMLREALAKEPTLAKTEQGW